MYTYVIELICKILDYEDRGIWIDNDLKNQEIHFLKLGIETCQIYQGPAELV